VKPHVEAGGRSRHRPRAARDPRTSLIKEFAMIGSLLHWAVVLVVIALVAALFGFGGLAGTATNIATTLFWVALVLAVILFLVNLMRGNRAL
jgi:uncharacterized membrane protein YtjA (UPF0391 family)